MELNEAIKILDPETRREALNKYDPEEWEAEDNKARQLAVLTMRIMYGKGCNLGLMDIHECGTFTPVPMPEPLKKEEET